MSGADTTVEPLHAQGAAAWDISDEVLAVIRSEVRPGWRTLETGAGQSTLAFLEAGAEHQAVTPSEDEVARIRAAAAARGLPVEKLTFHLGFSQTVLPTLSGPLDFVLIDGGHGFPIPAVDWMYTAPRLVVGGIMLIDDIDLWTGQMLTEFMDGEACWRREAILRGRTAAYRLVSPFELHEWTKQPTVVAKSRWIQRRRKAANIAAHVARGEFGVIRRKLEHERRLAEAAKDDY